MLSGRKRIDDINVLTCRMTAARIVGVTVRENVCLKGVEKVFENGEDL